MRMINELILTLFCILKREARDLQNLSPTLLKDSKEIN